MEEVRSFFILKGNEQIILMHLSMSVIIFLLAPLQFYIRLFLICLFLVTRRSFRSARG